MSVGENSSSSSDANASGFSSASSDNQTGEKGSVKWFNDAKGFGFIQHQNGKDVFVHFSVIECEGFKTLKDGEEVTYEFVEGPKGLQATKVLRTNPPPSSQVAKEEEPAPTILK